jgi:hypothetical protein
MWKATMLSDSEISIALEEDSSGMPSPAEVGELYAAAAAEPPLHESRETAELFADLYAASLSRSDLVAVSARAHGRLVGFAYGHPWQWTEQQDPWAQQLTKRLASQAPALDDTFALFLLARDPADYFRGLGHAVLTEWFAGIGDRRVWLLTTDVDSPARRLYASFGFAAIGHGPDAPDGNPGLVMLSGGHRHPTER